MLKNGAIYLGILSYDWACIVLIRTSDPHFITKPVKKCFQKFVFKQKEKDQKLLCIVYLFCKFLVRAIFFFWTKIPYFAMPKFAQSVFNYSMQCILPVPCCRVPIHKMIGIRYTILLIRNQEVIFVWAKNRATTLYVLRDASHFVRLKKTKMSCIIALALQITEIV